jgi:hypothetical protein
MGRIATAASDPWRRQASRLWAPDGQNAPLLAIHSIKAE